MTIQHKAIALWHVPEKWNRFSDKDLRKGLAQNQRLWSASRSCVIGTRSR